MKKTSESNTMCIRVRDFSRTNQFNLRLDEEVSYAWVSAPQRQVIRGEEAFASESRTEGEDADIH
jgi:hypothetical protein